MYCEMQNKLSNTRGSPLGSIGEIISSRCPHDSISYDLGQSLKKRVFAMVYHRLIEGNMFQHINHVMRKSYFYAPKETLGGI